MEGEGEEYYDEVDEEEFAQHSQSNRKQQSAQKSNTSTDTVVFDIGTHTCKVGFCSSEFPDAVVPSLLGFPKSSGEKSQLTEIYLGTEAYKK